MLSYQRVNRWILTSTYMIFRAQHLGQNKIEHVIQCDFLFQPDYRATKLDIFNHMKAFGRKTWIWSNKTSIF